MKVAVFGASGKVGVRVVELLLKAGHEVIAVVHSHDVFQGTPNLYVKKCDIHDGTAVAQVLKGTEAVISCVSSWGSPDKDVLTSAMQTIAPAMEMHGISRIVSLTGTGALTDQDKPSVVQQASHELMAKVAPKVLADGEEHIRFLQTTDLDWTVLRSPTMNNRGKSTYKLEAELPTNPLGTIKRQAVAHALVDLLTDQNWFRQAPCITRK
jgi:putative NADH-flavin reductase